MYRVSIEFQYRPTSVLMQILHFDWLRYQGTISNSHQVAKFAGFSFVFSPNKYPFNLHLLTVLLPFLSDQLSDTKTIRPFALKDHEKHEWKFGRTRYAVGTRAVGECLAFSSSPKRWTSKRHPHAISKQCNECHE